MILIIMLECASPTNAKLFLFFESSKVDQFTIFHLSIVDKSWRNKVIWRQESVSQNEVKIFSNEEGNLNFVKIKEID